MSVMAREWIDHALANFLNVNVGHSEEEAIGLLRQSVKENGVFAAGLRSDVSQALSDPTYSWKAVFSEYEAGEFGDEGSARSYATSLLWDSLFRA